MEKATAKLGAKLERPDEVFFSAPFFLLLLTTQKVDSAFTLSINSSGKKISPHTLQ